MKSIRVAVNGLGRIGRAFLKLALRHPELDVVAINDLGDARNLAYLLRYDSAYGRSGLVVDNAEGKLIIGGKEIIFLNERDLSSLPWKNLNVDIVIESTGVFEDYEKSKAHLGAGARRVIITAPVKNDPETVAGATVLMGVNEDDLADCDISSNASCTTNAVSPVIQILKETVGIKKALLNTIHGYTATQSLVDSPTAGDWRRGRAAAANSVPSTTGAAIAVTKAVKGLDNLFDGIAVRVPVIVGSLADLTFLAGRTTSIEEINDILRAASREARWEEIFAVTEEPLVSSDIIGTLFASIADLHFTKVVDGDLVKVLAWYDNEMGYANTLVMHVKKAGAYLTLSDRAMP